MRVLVAIACVLLGLRPGTASAAPSPDPSPRPAAIYRSGPVAVYDSTLAALTVALKERSATFARAMKTLESGGTPVLIGSPEQLLPYVPDRMMGESHLAHAIAVAQRGTGRPRLDRIVVMIDVAAFEEVYRRAGDLASLDSDLEIVLAHEVAGHAAGWVRSGRPDAGCLDPTPADLAASPGARGCAVERENVIRQELGLPERPTYLNLVYLSGHSHDEIDRVHMMRRQGLARNE